eukprot:gene9131-6418_t
MNSNNTEVRRIVKRPPSYLLAHTAARSPKWPAAWRQPPPLPDPSPASDQHTFLPFKPVVADSPETIHPRLPRESALCQPRSQAQAQPGAAPAKAIPVVSKRHAKGKSGVPRPKEAPNPPGEKPPTPSPSPQADGRRPKERSPVVSRTKTTPAPPKRRSPTEEETPSPAPHHTTAPPARQPPAGGVSAGQIGRSRRDTLHTMELPTATVEERLEFLNQRDAERQKKLQLRVLAEQGVARRPNTLIRSKYGPIQALEYRTSNGRAITASAAATRRANSAGTLALRDAPAAPSAAPTEAPRRHSSAKNTLKAIQRPYPTPNNFYFSFRFFVHICTDFPVSLSPHSQNVVRKKKKEKTANYERRSRARVALLSASLLPTFPSLRPACSFSSAFVLSRPQEYLWSIHGWWCSRPVACSRRLAKTLNYTAETVGLRGQYSDKAVPVMSVPRAVSCERPMLPAGMEPTGYGLHTPDRPTHFAGENTDDPAIFVFDTMDPSQASLLTTSPSAVAILTPQRLNSTQGCPQLDVSEYDGMGGPPRHRSPHGKSFAGRKSQERNVLVDVTHRTNTSANASWKTPVAKRLSASLQRAASVSGHNRCSCSPSPQYAPSRAEDTFLISVEELEALRRDRRRFEKMYEHQKSLYEEMRDRFGEVYRLYQQKIVEVMALSTRLEVSKTTIRQQKREAEARGGIVARENRMLKEIKKVRQEYQEKYDTLLEEHKTKLAAMDSLHKDISSMIEDNERIHISQLDSLLKASYCKTTALISDLLRQRKSHQALCEEKLAADRRLEAVVKERRSSEARYLSELSRRDRECERLYAQSEEQQREILHLRQLLIRTLGDQENAIDIDEDLEEGEEEEEEEEFEVDHSRSYSHPRPGEDPAEVSVIEREVASRNSSYKAGGSYAGLGKTLATHPPMQVGADRGGSPTVFGAGSPYGGAAMLRESTPLSHASDLAVSPDARGSIGTLPGTPAPSGCKLFAAAEAGGRGGSCSISQIHVPSSLFQEPRLSTSLTELHQRQSSDTPPSSVLFPRGEPPYSLGNSLPPPRRCSRPSPYAALPCQAPVRERTTRQILFMLELVQSYPSAPCCGENGTGLLEAVRVLPHRQPGREGAHHWRTARNKKKRKCSLFIEQTIKTLLVNGSSDIGTSKRRQQHARARLEGRVCCSADFCTCDFGVLPQQVLPFHGEMPAPPERELSLQQLEGAEKVVRIELERRECKKRLHLLDVMAREVDQQEVYVAQFKKEWLAHRQALERDRQKLVQTESSERERLEQWCRSRLKRIHTDFTTNLPGVGAEVLSSLHKKRTTIKSNKIKESVLCVWLAGYSISLQGTASLSFSCACLLFACLSAHTLIFRRESCGPPTHSLTLCIAGPLSDRHTRGSDDVPAPLAGCRTTATPCLTRENTTRLHNPIEPHLKIDRWVMPPKLGSRTRSTRVVKSALEMILEEPSPGRTTVTAPLPKEDRNAFSVTYAAAALGAQSGARRSPSKRGSGERNDPAEHLQFPCLQPAASSSPQPAATPQRIAAERSLFATPRTRCSTDAELSPTDDTDSRASRAWGNRLAAPAPPPPPEILEQALEEAIREYEARRDAEEAAALEAIQAEVERQSARCESLAALHQQVASQNTELQRELIRVEREKTALQVQMASVQETRAASTGEQWEEAQREMEAAHERVCTALRSKLQACQQAAAAHQADAEALRTRLAEEEQRAVTDRLARQQLDQERADVLERLSALSEYMTSVEGLLKEHEATIALLQAQLRDKERAKTAGLREVAEKTKSEKEELQAQVASLQGKLERQTDEVRRKSYRVAALEKERKLLLAELEQWRRTPEAVREQQAVLRHALVVLANECRAHHRRYTAALASRGCPTEGSADIFTEETPEESQPRARERPDAERGGGVGGGEQRAVSPHRAVRDIATENAGVIRVAQVLGRRTRSLLLTCTGTVRELLDAQATMETAWAKERILLEDTCRFLKGKSSKESKRADAAEAEAARLSALVEALEEAQSTAEDSMERLRRSAELAQQSKRSTDAALAAAEREVEQLREHTNEVQAQRDAAESAHKEAVAALAHATAELQAAQRRYTDDVEGPRAKCAKLSSRVKELEARRDELTSELSAAKGTVRDLTTQLTTLRSRASLHRQSQERSSKSAASELQTLRETVASVRSVQRDAAEAHKAEVAQLREELSSAKKAVRALRDAERLREAHMTEVEHRLASQSAAEKATLVSLLSAAALHPPTLTVQEGSLSLHLDDQPAGGEAVEALRQQTLREVQRLSVELAQARAEQRAAQTPSRLASGPPPPPPAASLFPSALGLDDDGASSDRSGTSPVPVPAPAPTAAPAPAAAPLPRRSRSGERGGSTSFSVYRDGSATVTGALLGVSTPPLGLGAAGSIPVHAAVLRDVGANQPMRAKSEACAGAVRSTEAGLLRGRLLFGPAAHNALNRLLFSSSPTSSSSSGTHSYPSYPMGNPHDGDYHFRSRKLANGLRRHLSRLKLIVVVRYLCVNWTHGRSHAAAMSSRQLRRLQNLVSAYTASDDLLEDDTGTGERESTAIPAIRPPKARRRAPRERPAAAGPDDVRERHDDPNAPLADVQNPSEELPLPTAKLSSSESFEVFKKEAQQKKVKKNQQPPPQQRGGQRRNVPKVLQQSPTESEISAAQQEPGLDLDLLQKLMACDVNHLDTRLERLRNFGAQSLEDIGDGRAPRRKGVQRNTGNNSIFVEHPPIRFAATPLVIPNQLRWPPYDSEGVSLVLLDAKGSGVGHDIYQIEAGNKYFVADLKREHLRESHGSVVELIESMTLCFYHLPTLIDLSRTFDLMNSTYRAHEMVDMALYRIGRLLSTFPLSGTWRERELPMRRLNGPIFEGLRLGFHHAMRRGCTRSAFELSRLLLSLDRRDPAAALLLMDYAALRSRKWVWLLEVYQESRAIAAAVQAQRFHLPNAKPTKDVAQRCALLPGFAFSAALAAFLLEGEASRPATKREKSKVLAELERSAAAYQYIKDLPSSETILQDALLRFPLTAVQLVEALGGPESVIESAPKGTTPPPPSAGPTVWDAVQATALALRVEEDSNAGMLALVEHLGELFVARQVDFWRPSGIIPLLGKVLIKVVDEADRTKAVPLAAFSHLNPSAALYVATTREDVTGAIPLIPPDALNQTDSDEGDESVSSVEIASTDEDVVELFAFHTTSHRMTRDKNNNNNSNNKSTNGADGPRKTPHTAGELRFNSR